MFNRSVFGRVAYNRPFSSYVSATATADVIIEALALAGVDSAPVAVADVIVEGTAAGLREIVGAYATADVIVEAIASASRDFHGRGMAEVIVEASARARWTRVESLTITGGFAPGDVIVIDAARLKVTKNGANALHLVTGNPFDLNLGDNNITYTDPASARAILTRITFRDKFV